VRDLLPALASAVEAGHRGAIAVVAHVYRSAPRQAGSAMVLLDDGRILGSVTGGCVEPDVLEHARRVLDGAPPCLMPYGIADEDAVAVGLPCGGQVDIFIEPLDADAVLALSAAVEADRPVAYATVVAGPSLGTPPRVVGWSAVPADPLTTAARVLLACGASSVAEVGDDTVLVHSLVPRAAMYVFGAIDHAAAVARMGRFLGYRVTVVDARRAFLTADRFPDADELVAEWPHRFLERAPVDRRTVICVLTHDAKYDVPAIRVALDTDAGYIGAMGSRRTTDRRRRLLLEEGISEERLARVHAPIGMAIGARTPQEVAVAIGAEIVATFRAAAARPVVAAPG